MQALNARWLASQNPHFHDWLMNIEFNEEFLIEIKFNSNYSSAF